MTLIEILMVLVILGIVIGALTQVFVSGIKAEVDMNSRFQAEQNTRLALDGLRREIHCADSVVSNQSGGTYPSPSITITLGQFCPSNNRGTGAQPGWAVWCTKNVSTSRNQLYRYFKNSSFTVSTCGNAVSGASGPVQKADYLTTPNVFISSSGGSGTGTRATLSIDLPVDVKPSLTGGRYELKDDNVLRNTPR